MSTTLDLARQILEQAKRAGAQEAEVIVRDARELQVRVAAQHVDFVKEAHTRGAGLRVFVEHRPAFVYSSDFRREAVADLAQRAVRLAHLSLPDEHAGLPKAEWLARDATPLELFDPAIPALSAEKRISMALAMEKAALGVDPRVKRTQGCGISSTSGTTALANSAGSALGYDSTILSLSVTALAEDTDGKQHGWGEGGAWRSLAQAPDPEVLGAKAGREAVKHLGPRKVPSQKVPVVMHPDVAEAWLQNLSGAFSGEEVLRKTSYLHDKLDTAIAASGVTLIDDGRRPRGAGSAPFDGEGVPTQRNVLIEAGVCKAFLYDAYTARKAGARPTGSAQRGYASVPSIGTRNLYLEPGNASFDDLVRGISKGFYYVDSGAFGYNPTTGDYAFQASGFWIENGAIAYPVDEITVGSTTLDMLRHIDAIGRDVEWRDSVTSPHLRISEMTVGS